VVNFTGVCQQIGEFVDVRITEALPNSLRAEVVTDDPLSSVMIRSASSEAPVPD